jgi:starch phosphorylase
VDVWLNNPVYPLEASGTSGMKAGINGVINLSILDGWWDEGYDGKNGWAIKPVSESFDDERRLREEAKALYELLQDGVIPTYYRRSDMGYSPDWIRIAKHSIASLLPRFSSTRMVSEYLGKFYLPATRQGRRFSENGFDAASRLAGWKAHVRANWDSVRLRRVDTHRRNITYGEGLRFEVAVYLDGMKPDDVVVELLLGRQTDYDTLRDNRRYRFEWEGVMTDQGEHRFVLQITPEMCGKLEYRIRVYTWHELLTHPFEMGMMRWL